MRFIAFFLFSYIALAFYFKQDPAVKRVVSSQSNEEILKELAQLSSHRESVEQVKERLKYIESAHQFLRAWPSLYWKIIGQSPIEPPMQKLSLYSGPVYGDVHTENFGTLVCDNEIHANINDYDDATTSGYIYDFIRLVISSELAGFEQNRHQFIKMYKLGLDGKLNTPKIVKDIVEDARNDLGETDDKYKVVSENPFIVEFKKFKDDYRKLNDDEKSYLSQFKKLVESEFKQKPIQIHDSYARTKTTGGSALLTRYNILYTYAGDVYQAEFKPLVKPSPHYQNRLRPLSTRKRIRLFNKITKVMGIKQSCMLKAVSFNRSAYILRAKSNANKDITPLNEEYSQETAFEVLEYQFNLLGHKQAQFMNKRKLTSYRKQLELAQKDIFHLSDYAKSQLLRYYNLATQ